MRIALKKAEQIKYYYLFHKKIKDIYNLRINSLYIGGKKNFFNFLNN